MKIPSRALIAVALLAAGALVAQPALAHRPRVHLGIGFNVGPYPSYWGPAYWGPWYYAAPVYHPAPVQYVERDQPQQQQSGAYWYYCETARGYYPYVKECPTGWKAVPPAPPPAQ